MSISPLLPIIITFAIALFIMGLPLAVLGKLQPKELFKVSLLFAFTAISSASIYAYFSDYSILDILFFQRDLAYPNQLILRLLSKILYMSVVIGLPSLALLACALVSRVGSNSLRALRRKKV